MLEQKQPELLFSKTGVNSFLGVFFFIARTFGVTVEVFLRRSDSFGQRYFGLQAAAGFVLILFWPVLWQEHSAGPMLVFLALYWLALLTARIRTRRRVKLGGTQPHTLYNGAPTLQKVWRRNPEHRVKTVIEPLYMGAIALCVAIVSVPLAAYLAVAGVCAAASSGMGGALQHRRTMDLHDAFVEQRDTAESFRRMRDGR
ncbi:MAG: hypothetical protein KJ057_09050 [Phycisphaerae bacterium]|nr:MAG: hypothetical protein EDS66_14365 [Planctomycetota bacterium]MBE7456091.1 hypothetical protein [Planctomycetia bacterium]MCL4718605.1 hypothetical protein [Phycisphaerae bacterium]MCQ3921271.1 hypothetical protein [Planctomycetota bacterium]